AVIGTHEEKHRVLGMTPGRTDTNRWYRLGVQARGNNFKVFLDGKLLNSAFSDEDPQGCVGLGTNTVACFRNLKVTDPSGKVLLEGLDNVLAKPKVAPVFPGKRPAVFSTPWCDSDDWIVKGQELVQPNDNKIAHMLFGDPSWADYNYE